MTILREYGLVNFHVAPVTPITLCLERTFIVGLLASANRTEIIKQKILVRVILLLLNYILLAIVFLIERLR